MHSSLALVPFALATACAVGNTHRYDLAVAEIPFSGNTKVAVTTEDRRPYVLNRDKEPDFVGLQRGGYGNPFDVTTASGDPLASDMTAVLRRSLDAKGFTTIPIVLAVDGPVDSLAEKVSASGAERVLILTLREWKSDTYTNTALIYDVSLRVIDAAGAIRAETELQGRDDLGGSFWNPPAHAKDAVPQAFQKKLEILLGEPEIAAALR